MDSNVWLMFNVISFHQSILNDQIHNELINIEHSMDSAPDDIKERLVCYAVHLNQLRDRIDAKVRMIRDNILMREEYY